jgi:hypothetical protein
VPKTKRSGRKNKLTGQLGEYLVAAEVARRGLIATTFTGNVPHYDIVASDDTGRHVSVQVKTSNGPSWQFALDRFCHVQFRGDQQIIGNGLPAPVRRLVVVLVLIGDGRTADRFFICSWLQLRSALIRSHSGWLKEHGGRRPKNPKSLHSALVLARIVTFENCWDTIRHSLR